MQFGQPIVEFSQLESDEKQRYIEFLLSNNVKFVKGEKNDFVAKIKIFSEGQGCHKSDENMNKQNRVRSKSPREIFALAKKNSRIIQNNRSSKNSRSSSIIKQSYTQFYQEIENNQNLYPSFFPPSNKSPHKKIQTASIIPGVEEIYPEFYRNIKAIDVWMRPKKLSKELLMLQIEEIYSTKYQEATNKIQNKKQTICQDNLLTNFPQFVYSVIKNNVKTDRHTQQRSIDLLASVEYYSLKHPDILIFQKFLSQKYLEEELMFFLFVRAIIEKELNIQIYHQNRKNVSNLSELFLTLKQIQNILQLVYGSEETQQIETMLKQCDQKINNHKEKPESINPQKHRLNCLELINLALVKYHNDRKHKHVHQIMQISNSSLNFSKNDMSLQDTKYELNNRNNIEPIPNDKYKKLKSMIGMEVFKQLTNFLKENIGTTNIQEELQDVFADLLQSVFKYDKMIWFYRIQLHEPEQDDLLYIENLQKSFRRMQKLNTDQQDPQEINIFAKRIMQTPQLAKTIGKILLIGQQQI